MRCGSQSLIYCRATFTGVTRAYDSPKPAEVLSSNLDLDPPQLQEATPIPPHRLLNRSLACTAPQPALITSTTPRDLVRQYRRANSPRPLRYLDPEFLDGTARYQCSHEDLFGPFLDTN